MYLSQLNIYREVILYFLLGHRVVELSTLIVSLYDSNFITFCHVDFLTISIFASRLHIVSLIDLFTWRIIHGLWPSFESACAIQIRPFFELNLNVVPYFTIILVFFKQ